MAIRQAIGIGAVITVVLASSCGEEPTATVGDTPAFAVNGAGRLAVYNAGVDRAVPDTPCMDDARHRQFDFWVGGWQIGPLQRSLIRNLLDGCMIEENYMPPVPPLPGKPPGPPMVSGRSISAYDRDTGKWHQTWVPVFPNGILRLTGDWQDTAMVMEMPVIRPTGPAVIQVRWTPAHPDTVLQSFATNGVGGPALKYARRTDVQLAGIQLQPFCQPGSPIPAAVQNRQIDFLLGTWLVHADKGPTLGSATVSSDLNGCLGREDYTTDKGYAAHSYIYYDIVFQKWFRTYIDSEAERVELSGTFTNGMLVLEGREPGPGGAVFHVRNTIKPIDANTVQQLWETSDDGTVWRVDQLLTFSRNGVQGS